jgi:type II secretory pathway pseudopilin PulG
MLLLSLAMQGVMTYVSQQAQRGREQDMLRIGQAYLQAIGAYYESTPGGTKQWPRKLEDLVEDRRFLTVKRHLRDLYPDPITRALDWELVRTPDGGISGIRSRSKAAPIRTIPIELDGVTLAPASSYSDWQFVYQPVASIPAIKSR